MASVGGSVPSRTTGYAAKGEVNQLRGNRTYELSPRDPVLMAAGLLYPAKLVTLVSCDARCPTSTPSHQREPRTRNEVLNFRDSRKIHPFVESRDLP